MGRVIGIDLGTTNSCVAVAETTGSGKVEVKIIPNDDGARTTPSVVALSKNGERLVGAPARRQAATSPKSTLHAIKRLMGRRFNSIEVTRQAGLVSYEIIAAENGDAWVNYGGQLTSPPEISALVLGKMKAIAETYLGEEVTEAVVTVPAYFDDAQRQATKDAGKIAGLEVRRIINEPTAAALAYGLEKKERELVAVYDLGGGTFDISILEILGGVFSVKATNGDTYLGGEDFDLRIIEELANKFQAENGVDLRKDSGALARLREGAEKAKHELSSSLETQINIPYIAVGPAGPLHIDRPITRAELELLTSNLIERTLVPCKNALQDAGLSAADITSVVLVGGMTRMPAVQKAVKEFFGKEPSRGVNPDEVVAAGAALQGVALDDKSMDVLLVDVMPLSLGVETGGGVFTVLIPRNTSIPTEKSEVFTTSLDNQSFVPVHVLQGERAMAVDNRTLARFELTGIPPAPRGVPKIQVTFAIDANGVVSIDARDLGTGRVQQMRVTASSGLTQEDVDRIIAQSATAADEDAARKELAEVRNQAQSLLLTSESAVEGYRELVDADRVADLMARCQDLRAALDSNADIVIIREAYQSLEATTIGIAEALYG
jgi:molecular chaperone DnaK